MKNINAVTKNKTAPKATQNEKAVAPAKDAKAVAPIADTNLGPNAKFPFAVKLADTKGAISWERFKTAKERDARYVVLKRAPGTAKRVDFTAPAETVQAQVETIMSKTNLTASAALAEVKKSAAKTAAAPAPATKPAKAAKPAKAPKAPAETVLKVRLYSKGEFYFGRHVAARIGSMTHVALEANGKKVTLTPTKSTKDTFPLMYCHKAPVLRVKEALKDLGIVTVSTQDLIAKPVGETAFTVEVK